MAPDPQHEQQQGRPMSVQEAVRLNAEERERMERETQRLREENEDNARRIEYVRARARVLLGGGRADH